MITTIRRNLTSFFKSYKIQIHSVVPDHDFDEFAVQNEPILGYLPNSKERTDLEAVLDRMSRSCEPIPIVIGDEEIHTNITGYQVIPHKHQQKLAKYFNADLKTIEQAIAQTTEKQIGWDETNIKDRIALWLRAADLMAGKYRQELNAATMLGQGKTVYQAEIDSAVELVDFMRFNAYYMKELLKVKLVNVSDNTKNTIRYRGLEGFVAAISPFNFTAIGGNLAYTPALCGNCVIWKPAPTAMLSNWIIFKIMREAGLPAGVVNFVPCDGPLFGDTITASPFLAAINFTGSVPTFQRLCSQVGANITNYQTFPRLIGECGGKNFHFVHPSADVDAVVSQTIRAAFEFSGQKCSACSRLYVPLTLWREIKWKLVDHVKNLNIGDVRDFRTFTGAVIDQTSFNRINQYIEYARKQPCLNIIAGGTSNGTEGYFVCPTIIVTQDPFDKLMREEIFGPILTVYVYPDDEVNAALDLVRISTPFALTGSIFAENPEFICEAWKELKMTAGNLYINSKSTSAVVGQQPFGGAKLSGTNDKAGGPFHILRFLSPQTVKEDILAVKNITYPYMKE